MEIINSSQKVIFPVNWNSDHWLVITLSPKEQEIGILDSLPSHTGDSGRRVIVEVRIRVLEKSPTNNIYRV
jgi:Ulp1 family protease